MANRSPTVEGEAAIAVGESLIAALRPLNEHQRAWAVTMVLAEFSIDDPEFVRRIVFMLTHIAKEGFDG